MSRVGDQSVDPAMVTLAADDLEAGLSSTLTDHAAPVVGERYEILAMLGAGGMGTVYRARDRELDEIVALKILKKDLASSTGMLERFRREVKLARRVTHRNVARTFDIGESRGDRYLTMELIEGEMLGSALERRGRVPLREVLAIGVDVCEGLAAAHAAGVLHRDLKPENVILARDGRAVITDFGIARAFAEAEKGRTVGGLIGTPAYMAPEQVEGSSDLDGRVDLYALGAMLFELLTGRPAWTGATVFGIAAARLLRPPPDPRLHLPELPEPVALLVLRLMARVRDERPASAAEAGAELRALGDTLPAPSLAPRSFGADRAVAKPVRASRTAIGVLPLQNLGDPADEYLAQALTEDLVDLLSVVPHLKVRPRGDTARFAERSRDVRDAGRDLGVDVIVDGSIRRLGDTIRFAVRLFTVEDGFQLWARRFDGPPAYVLQVAEEAASAVTEALAKVRTEGPRPIVADPEAQELYLRGRYLMHRAWFEVSRQGVELLREAHQRAPGDPRIAGTYALAIARVTASDGDTHEAAAEARALAERTLAADDRQAEARVALGFLHINSGESEAAAIQLSRALAVAPSSVEALDAAGRMLIEAGRTDLGTTLLRQALAIDPQLAHAVHSIARAHALAGDYAGACAELGGLPAAAGDRVPYLLLRARLALWFDDRAAAPQLAAMLAASGELSPFATASLVGFLEVVQTRTADERLRAALERSLPIGDEFSPRRACYHAQLRVEIELATGLVEAAIADLRVANAKGLVDILWLDGCPLFAPHRHRADFQAVRQSTATRASRVLAIFEPRRGSAPG
ncbi:MAG: hypothetical protein JWP97_4229 [Labilithrix sp.]|nr:hypothetical protein [Labilithrix sp.]